MGRLRHSAPDWCFAKEGELPPEEYYRRVREAGCTAAELVGRPRRAAAREAGLDILSVAAPGMQEGLNRRENHDRLLADIASTIAEAAEDGLRQVVVFSGNRDGVGPGEGLENCVRALRRLAPLAGEAGVRLTFEMLNSHDHPGYQADSAGFGLRVAREVASPAVGILYDVYHLARMGRPTDQIIADVSENIEALAHVHVAGCPGRGFPGPEQRIDYRRIVAALLEAGYEGYVGYEFLPGDDPLGELAEAVRLFEGYAEEPRG